MSDFAVRGAGQEPDLIAADGSRLTLLARTARASMAHGSLDAGATSRAIRHRTVDEVWFVVSGAAEIWRANAEQELTATVETGDSLAIPCGTSFQYRTLGDAPFQFVMTTTPPWPGDDEVMFIDGPWPFYAAMRSGILPA